MSQQLPDVKQYLEDRVLSPNYRGPNIGQQNRLRKDKLLAILECIEGVVGDRQFAVPPGDDGPGRDKSSATYRDYEAILSAIADSQIEGVSATYNSLKKNHFPNLRSMRLMSWSPARGQVPYGSAQLTSEAIEILGARGITQANLIGMAFQHLFTSNAPEGFLDDIYALVDTHGMLNQYEMMLIVSDTARPLKERSELIRAYRRMKKVARLALHRDIEEFCKSTLVDTGTGGTKKTEKRDWGNWMNQARQTLSMLAFVPSFNVYQDEFVTAQGGMVSAIFAPSRSTSVKTEALKWHEIEKRDGWDLHHIYPIEYATSEQELKKIDTKENLLYIPRRKHRAIPTKGNLAVQLECDPNYVVLSTPGDPTGSKFRFSRDKEEVLVGTGDQLQRMMDYNRQLLAL